MKAAMLLVVLLVVFVLVLSFVPTAELISGIEGTMSVTSDMVYLADEAMAGTRCVSYDLAHAVGAIDDINPCK